MAQWVQLTTIQRVLEKGIEKTYHPGDWVQVGRQTANLWISRGQAIIPGIKGFAEISDKDVGVVTPDGGFVQQLIDGKADIKVVQSDEPRIEFPYTVWVHPTIILRPNIIQVGVGLLSTWELCVPLQSYERLAANLGSNEQQEYLKSIIHDLRVPVYSTQLMFLKDCENCRQLVDVWNDERGKLPDEMAFLAALYQVKPFVLALPSTWLANK